MDLHIKQSKEIRCALFNLKGDLLFSELSEDFNKILQNRLTEVKPFILETENKKWQIVPSIQENKILFKVHHSTFNYIHKLLELFYTAFEESYDGVIITDSEGKVVYLNRNYTRYLQVKLETSLGKHVCDVIPDTRMHIVLQTRKPEIGAIWKLNDRPLIVSRFPLFTSEGALAGSIGLIMFRRSIELTELIHRIHKMEKKLDYFEQKEVYPSAQAKYTFEHIRTNSSNMKELIEKAKKIATTSSNVLLYGDSGTGKELLAHAIHGYSPRSTGPFIKVNCAAIPESLFESELFGYEDGAFTGSRKGGKPGKFELANNGTIFLDEVGEMPLDMQIKLLRVIQERELERIGSTQIRSIDIRIIAASNKDLSDLVKKNLFREDLYYRLNVYRLEIPSLQNRKSDIPLLAEFFLSQMQEESNMNELIIDPETMRILISHNWPGNIRELRNVIEVMAGILEGNIIRKENLPAYLLSQDNISVPQSSGLYPDSPEGLDYWNHIHNLERKLIIEALQEAQGEKKKAAQILGVARSLIYKKMKELDIQEKHLFF